MAVPYTMGIWRVKPGGADEFVAAWSEFADWKIEHAEGTGWGKLLQDTADAHRFISIGPWESLAAIDAWRAHPGWQDRVARIRDLLEGFEPFTLEAIVERG